MPQSHHWSIVVMCFLLDFSDLSKLFVKMVHHQQQVIISLRRGKGDSL